MIVPIIIGTIKFTRLDLPRKLIWYLMIYTFVTELCSIYYLDYYDVPAESKNNTPMFHLYSYLEFGIMAFIFHRKSNDSLWKSVIKLMSFVFYIFSICNLIFLESIWNFNSNQRFVEGVFVLIILIGFFVQLMRDVEDIYFERNSYFWLAAGFLIYFTGTLFVFLFEKKFMDYWIAAPKEEFVDYYGYIHGVIFIILLIHYSIFLWMKEQK